MKDYKYCPICGSELIKKNIGEREYLGCSTTNCDFIFWDNPVPVVAAIIEIDDEVLLARNKLWPEKMFGLVTGFLEKGESPETAVIREVKEEVSLNSKIVELVGIYPFYQMNQLLLVYYLEAWGTIKLGDELAEYILVPVKKLKPWPFGTGLAVSDWLKKQETKES